VQCVTRPVALVNVRGKGRQYLIENSITGCECEEEAVGLERDRCLSCWKIRLKERDGITANRQLGSYVPSGRARDRTESGIFGTRELRSYFALFELM